MDERRVIVIGAGAAGLSAAYELKKRGVPVLLLEASNRAGGRMAGDVIDDFCVETGAQFFSTTHTVALQLAGELDVRFARSAVPTISTIYNSRNQKTGTVNPSRIFNFDNIRTFLSFGVFSPRGIAQFFKFVGSMRKRKNDLRSECFDRLKDLDVEESFADWCRTKIGDEFLEEFCRFAIASITLSTPERISALNGMMMLWVAFLDSQSQLQTPERGIGYFSKKLVEACTDVMRLATPVDRVVIENGTAKGVMTRQNGLLEADAVICATPASAAALIIPQLPTENQEFLKRVQYNQCCHVVFGVDRHPLPHGHYFFMLQRKSESILDCFFDSAIGSPFQVPEGSGLIHAYPSEEVCPELLRLDDDTIKDKVIDEIRKFAPAMPKDPLFTRVYRWEEAVVLPYGGMMRRLESLRAQGFPNVQGLFLAGDYLELLANVNSALKTGIHAADEVIHYFRASTPTKTFE